MAQNFNTVRVDTIRREAVDVMSFRLVDPAGDALPEFTPGSHIDVRLPTGLVRQYSLCNEPTERLFYEIAVKREPNSRGGSAGMCEQIRQGDLIAISRPRNNFALVECASDHLLLAGGIGVTPLLSMARHLRRAGMPFRLHYFVRSDEHAAFRDVLSSRSLSRHVEFHRAIVPERLSDYLRELLGDRCDGSHLYLCGPTPFMDVVRVIASEHWPSESIHMEYFAADVQAVMAPGQDFEVTLARSGGTYRVPPDKTIIEVLAQHGIAVDVSCEQGVCGTCLTSVLGGTPDHRDAFLTEDEKRSGLKMLPCVSRSESERLVLDL